MVISIITKICYMHQLYFVKVNNRIDNISLHIYTRRRNQVLLANDESGINGINKNTQSISHILADPDRVALQHRTPLFQLFQISMTRVKS